MAGSGEGTPRLIKRQVEALAACRLSLGILKSIGVHCKGILVVNFIHDEVLVEFPIEGDHNVQKIMIDEMRSVVSDVPVTCEYPSCQTCLSPASMR